ncbi:MAG TPA: glycosyltransferase [Anaerolineae bacterium]|nr:glycosyltransferase [Anaerolineae bacterium]
MNVGLFADCYQPTVSGVVTSLRQLKQGLEQRGHKVVLFVPATRARLCHSATECTALSGANDLQSGGSRHAGSSPPEGVVARFPSLPFNRASGFRLALVNPRAVWRLARRAKLDIIHTHTEYSLGWAGKSAARHLGIPFVHTTHTLHQAYLHYLPLGRVISTRFVHRYLRLFLSNCATLICPSEKARGCFQAFLPQVRAVVVDNGIEPAEFCPQPLDTEPVASIRQALRLGPTAEVILYAGRIAREKRVVELLDALVPLLHARPQARVLFVGSGPADRELAAAVEGSRVRSQVILAGRVEWARMHHFYSAAHLFVTASLSEMQPMTLIEAALCGLPVVARRDPAYAGLVRDGYNGYLVGSDSEIAARAIDLFENEEKRGRLAENARLLSAAFSAQRHVEEVERIYQQVTGLSLP